MPWAMIQAQPNRPMARSASRSQAGGSDPLGGQVRRLRADVADDDEDERQGDRRGGPDDVDRQGQPARVGRVERVRGHASPAAGTRSPGRPRRPRSAAPRAIASRSRVTSGRVGVSWSSWSSARPAAPVTPVAPVAASSFPGPARSISPGQQVGRAGDQDEQGDDDRDDHVAAAARRRCRRPTGSARRSGRRGGSSGGRRRRGRAGFGAAVARRRGGVGIAVGAAVAAIATVKSRSRARCRRRSRATWIRRGRSRCRAAWRGRDHPGVVRGIDAALGDLGAAGVLDHQAAAVGLHRLAVDAGDLGDGFGDGRLVGRRRRLELGVGEHEAGHGEQREGPPRGAAATSDGETDAACASRVYKRSPDRAADKAVRSSQPIRRGHAPPNPEVMRAHHRP